MLLNKIISFSIISAFLISGCDSSLEPPKEDQNIAVVNNVSIEEQNNLIKKQIEEQKRQQKEREEVAKKEIELKRSFISVKFSHISETGYVMVLITNTSAKDIQGISGGFKVEDLEGKSVFSTGLTIQKAPGEIYLASGKTVEQSPYNMDSKADVMEKLKNDSNSLIFFYEASEIKYSDGTEAEQLKKK